MGARTQIKVNQGDGSRGSPSVYLYGHWASGSILRIVHAALSRGVRWDDPEYLARILFDALTEGRQGDDTGAGIGLSLHGDLDNWVEVIPPCIAKPGGRVDFHLGSSEEGGFGAKGRGKPAKSWTFKGFTALEPDNQSGEGWGR